MKDLFSDEPALANYPITEDPERPEDNLYPVLVYIHGEDFAWGAGSLHDGRVLATYGKVIVVTFNFRIGVLGEYLQSNVPKLS